MIDIGEVCFWLSTILVSAFFSAMVTSLVWDSIRGKDVAAARAAANLRAERADLRAERAERALQNLRDLVRETADEEV